MATGLTTKQALERTRHLAGEGPHLDAQIIDQPCPKCGGTILCAYADIAPVDFLDCFAHICLNPNCDYVEESINPECSLGGRPGKDPVTCPFCKREVNATG